MDIGKVAELAKKIQESQVVDSVYSYMNNKLRAGGDIHIKKSHRGLFTQAAERRGMSVPALEKVVLAHPDRYSSTLVKQANFSHNARGWKHDNGGMMIGMGDYALPIYVDSPDYVASPKPVQEQEPFRYSDVQVRSLMHPETLSGRLELVYSPADALSVSSALGVDKPVQELPIDIKVSLGELNGISADKTINAEVSKLKSGEDLKTFQKELLDSGYYNELPTPKITAKTKEEIKDLQRKLKEAGYDIGTTGENKDGIDGVVGRKTRAAWEKYVKEHPDEAIVETVADGKMGPATREAAKAYYADKAAGIDRKALKASQQTIQPATQENAAPIGDAEFALSFPEYLYASGAIGTGRRIDNVLASTGNLINGFINPHGSNAYLSEGARRQLLGASLRGFENRGSYGVSDVEHQQLGGMSGHSGQEFREDDGFMKYLRQMADAPYHNIYGQSSSTFDPSTGMFSPGKDAYTFNNVWRGDKVVEVKDDGTGTGSLIDSYKQFVEARKSGASIKASIESAASVRGTDVKHDNRTSTVSQEDLEKYKKEYEKYLSDEKTRESFNRAYEKRFGKRS